MGLLERATLAEKRSTERSTERPGSSVEELPKTQPARRRRSLLQRSLTLLESPRPEPEPAAESPLGQPAPPPVEPVAAPEAAAPPTVEELTGDLLAKAGALSATIDLPSRLFSLLVDGLRIAKGALLLFDPVRQVYAPWASVGFDQTTHRRLRIPGAGLDVLAAAANGESATVTPAAGLPQLQQFFSSREYSGLDRVLIVPLAVGGKLPGFLLVTEADPPFGQEGLLGCLARVAGAVAPAMQEVRERALRVAAAPSPPEEAEAELGRRLAPRAVEGARFQVFSVSLERWAERLLATLRNLDPFRLEEDLRSIVSTFVSETGAAVNLGGARFLVAVRGFSAEHLDLFAHQLAVLLGSLSGDMETAPSDIVLGPPHPFPPEQ